MQNFAGSELVETTRTQQVQDETRPQRHNIQALPLLPGRVEDLEDKLVSAAREKSKDYMGSAQCNHIKRVQAFAESGSVFCTHHRALACLVLQLART